MNNGSGSQLLIRHEARSPAGVDALEHYANGVAVMKRRKAEDPTSWTYQAAIHGNGVLPPQEGWNECEHQSWFFLPWHRMYLYYFEQIVRRAIVEAGGPEDWALPYWDYSPGGEAAALPEQFRQPGDEESNPLYVEERHPYYNEGGRLPHKPPDSVVSPEKALEEGIYTGVAKFGGGDQNLTGDPHFWGNPGLLERSPHNGVHREIQGWMGSSATAAQDPIFWLHHCNIDRIWAVWNELENRENPKDGRWPTHEFTFFDTSGKKVSKACGAVEDTIAHLNYTFEPSPGAMVRKIVSSLPPPPPPDDTPQRAEPRFLAATESEVPLTGEAVEVPVAIDARGRREVLETARSAGPRRLYLNIEDVTGGEDAGSVYSVYLNLPQDPDQEDLERHYVGNLSFFGIEEASSPTGDKKPHGMRASFEVGPLLERLREETGWNEEEDQLQVSIAPVVAEAVEGVEAPPPGAGRHAPVHIGRISLSTDT
jgi:tyrosinase